MALLHAACTRHRVFIAASNGDVYLVINPDPVILPRDPEVVGELQICPSGDGGFTCHWVQDSSFYVVADTKLEAIGMWMSMFGYLFGVRLT